MLPYMCICVNARCKCFLPSVPFCTDLFSFEDEFLRSINFTHTNILYSIHFIGVSTYFISIMLCMTLWVSFPIDIHVLCNSTQPKTMLRALTSHSAPGILIILYHGRHTEWCSESCRGSLIFSVKKRALKRSAPVLPARTAWRNEFKDCSGPIRELKSPGKTQHTMWRGGSLLGETEPQHLLIWAKNSLWSLRLERLRQTLVTNFYGVKESMNCAGNAGRVASHSFPDSSLEKSGAHREDRGECWENPPCRAGWGRTAVQPKPTQTDLLYLP